MAAFHNSFNRLVYWLIFGISFISRYLIAPAPLRSDGGRRAVRREEGGETGGGEEGGGR